MAAPPKPPRSILKPAVALPEIPPLKKGRSSETSKPPRNSRDDSSGSKIALRTEEEQQAAAREREERERRDARRKSLANRRVSFAAEATLHTFHEVEYMQDSTASTDSTRRASAAASNRAHQQGPADEDDTQQNKRRRSSGLPSNFHSREDDTGVSTIYSSDSEPPDAVEEVEDEEVEEDSNSDSDDGTLMTIATEEVTGTSMGGSDRSMDSDDENSIDEALRLAARTAGVQSRDQDSEEDEDDDEEVIPSFGWIKKGTKSSHTEDTQITSNFAAPQQEETMQMEDGTEMDLDMDMDMTNAVGKILKPYQQQKDQSPEDEADEEMSMDVTRAYGAILNQNNNGPTTENADEDEDDAPMEEATMEFTTAIGGIRRPRQSLGQETELDENEDMSMELTSVIGGLLGAQKRKSVGPSRRQTLNRLTQEDSTMDMTMGLGRILPSNQPPKESVDDNADDNAEEEPDEDMTMGMDMTTAIGGILANAGTADRTLGKRIMEEEVDKPNTPTKAILAAVGQKSHEKKQQQSEEQSDPNSPGLSAFHGRGLRRSMGAPTYVAPQTRAASRTPSPPKPTTPRSTIRSAAKRNTRSREATPKSASPQKAPSAGRKTATPSPAKSTKKASSLFQDEPGSAQRTPSVVLTPQRTLSGVGADRPGLGSPKITAAFERRESIGDSATDFMPGKRGVTFADPKEMEQEVDREREEEEDRENNRRILEREVNGPDEGTEPTSSLREMIDSLSPKRNPLKGRKSLHVGSARGLLGKRPFELDDEDRDVNGDDDEENDGVKRLKGHQGSPVKNIRLQNPPSKEETAGRLFRSSQLNSNSGSTPSLSSPARANQPKSPHRQTRFKDVDDEPTTREVDFDDARPRDAAQLEEDIDEDRIHLQDFLNMTSIRFMELTTTKRRHTAAPSSFKNGLIPDDDDDLSLERCVVAGACTVPNLELYQHSCRELKKYISEGRRIVKEIENDTLEENPPLFREYISATPDVKALMDNQFKNVKTHARLLSKAMWYEWRMKLQDGLKEGLINTGEDMTTDEELLQKQQDLLDSVLPAAMAHYDSLVEQHSDLQEVAKEIADSDPAELQAARRELASLDADIAQKKKAIKELGNQFQTSEGDVEALTAQKEECLADIKESEKVREECRGWTNVEIDALKGKTIDQQHSAWVLFYSSIWIYANSDSQPK